MDRSRFGSAVILCGGRSSRMGFDKCNIRIGGVPIHERIGRQLEGVFDEVLLITNSNRRITSKRYRVVEDVVEQRGPMGGILTGLMEAGSGNVFFTACDMPIVKPGVIRLMAERMEAGGHLGVVGEKDGYVEPLYSFFSKTFAGVIKSELSDPANRVSIARLVRKYDILRVPEADWRGVREDRPELDCFDIYTNINHPCDLELLGRIYNGEEVSSGTEEELWNPQAEWRGI